MKNKILSVLSIVLSVVNFFWSNYCEYNSHLLSIIIIVFIGFLIFCKSINNTKKLDIILFVVNISLIIVNATRMYSEWRSSVPYDIWYAQNFYYFVYSIIYILLIIYCFTILLQDKKK